MGKKVLVVDDCRDTVATTLALLELRGHEAKGCHNAVEIVSEIREFDPDVVVLDIAMPRKTGWEAAKEIRARIVGRRPLLIAVSGEYTKGTDKVLSELVGFDYYLMKPADPQRLLLLVEKTPSSIAAG